MFFTNVRLAKPDIDMSRVFLKSNQLLASPVIATGTSLGLALSILQRLTLSANRELRTMFRNQVLFKMVVLEECGGEVWFWKEKLGYLGVLGGDTFVSHGLHDIGDLERTWGG